MKEYPSIPKDIRTDVTVIAFDKLDGSLIRAEWNRKNGFCKFGRKAALLDHSYPVLLRAPDLIRSKYADQLDAVFRENRWDQVVAFFEFFGKTSFAGQHSEDEQQDVVLIDINPYKKGILDPRDFVKIFGHLDIPKVLYRGKVNHTLAEDVKNGKLSGMTFEGVVCKGSNPKKPNHRVMFKIKNLAWVTKLKEFCGNDEKKFRELL